MCAYLVHVCVCVVQVFFVRLHVFVCFIEYINTIHTPNHEYTFNNRRKTTNKYFKTVF